MEDITNFDYFLYLVYESDPLSVIDLITLDEFKHLLMYTPFDKSTLYFLKEVLYQFHDNELYEWCHIIKQEIDLREQHMNALPLAHLRKNK